MIHLRTSNFWLCFFFVHIAACDCYNILFFTLYGSKSHVDVFVPAIEALQDKGHNITYLTIIPPQWESENNATVLHLQNVEIFLRDTEVNIFDLREGNFTTLTILMRIVTLHACRVLMEDPSFLRIVKDNSTRYDAIIMDPVFNECGLALVWLLNSPPLIYYCTTHLYPWTALSVGVPLPMAYIPAIRNDNSEQMTFLQRVHNIFDSFLFYFVRITKMFKELEDIIHEYHPSIPRLVTIEGNASFVFANTHATSMDYKRPQAPFFAEVGGTHCRPSKPLTKDLEKFIAGAGKHGFIYFSLGTYVKAENMPSEMLNAFTEAFSRLKQRVIWRFEIDLPNIPQNVKIHKWVPQQDLLGHKGIKLFITQGGQLSLQEAVYHSVPVIGIPFVMDQTPNIRNMITNGMAVHLDHDFNGTTLFNAIMEIVSNERYKQNCLHYSKLMNDRPMKAIDTITYWVEYIIRHNGAHHLRFNTRHLGFHQYFLLDVFVPVTLLFGLLVFCTGMTIKWTYLTLQKRYLVKRTDGKKSQ